MEHLRLINDKELSRAVEIHTDDCECEVCTYEEDMKEKYIQISKDITNQWKERVMKKINLFKREKRSAKEKALHLSEKLHAACMEKLLNNPDLTMEDAGKLLNDMVEQAGGLKDLSFKKFDELFTGTLEAMGIDTTTPLKEVDMKDKAKKLVDRVKGVSLKAAGKVVGSATQAVAKPVLKFTDGFMEGWTSKERVDRS